MKTISVLIGLLLSFVQLNATIYYVSPTGSDSNTGLATNNASARLGIKSTLRIMVANDELQLVAGSAGQTTFTESLGSALFDYPNIMDPRSGTGSGNYTKVRSYPGQRITIQPNNNYNCEAFYLGSFNYSPNTKSNTWWQDITFDMINATNNFTVMKVSDAVDNVITNCLFINSGGRHGVLLNGDRNSFYNCTSTNNGLRFRIESNDQHAWYVGGNSNLLSGCVGGQQAGGDAPHCFHINAVGGGGSVNGNVLSNCFFYGGLGSENANGGTTNIAARGIGVYQGIGNRVIGCYGTNAVIGIYFAYGAIQTLIQNCTVQYCGTNGYGGAFYGDTSSSVSNMWVNCAAHSNYFNGFYTGSGLGLTYASNCIASKNSGSDLANNIGSTLVQSGNDFTGNAVPKFTSSADFHISSTSSLRNAGTAQATPSNDPSGVSRPQEGIWDVGAFEYNAGGITPVYQIAVGVTPGSQSTPVVSATLIVTRDVTTLQNTNYFQFDASNTGIDTTDFTHVATNLVFNVGVASQTITITPTTGTPFAGSKTVRVNLWTDSTYSLGAVTNATVTFTGSLATRIGYQTKTR